MSIAQKQAHQRASIREASVICPVCETQTTATDLLEHMDKRCPGPRSPHPASKWISWRQARSLGVLPGTLSRWVNRGLVRVAGDQPQCRLYLAKDIVVRLAALRAQQRR